MRSIVDGSWVMCGQHFVVGLLRATSDDIPKFSFGFLLVLARMFYR